MNTQRIEQIRERLTRQLKPVELDIRDDSALHAGHAGARGGAGHYAVRIRAQAFCGLSKLQRHRLVYDAVADMMPDEIHALSIDAHQVDDN